MEEENKHRELAVMMMMMTKPHDGGGACDYVGNAASEEEYETYKTSSLPKSSQSEQFKQQQKQELATNALISTLGLFLVRTWNWLQYFLVTIIFLNLVHFANKLASSGANKGDKSVITVLEAKSVEVENDDAETVTINENTVITTTEEKSESGNIIEENEDNSTDILLLTLFEEEEDNNQDESQETLIKMSPNTCSIQNQQQEVEKAEEAVVAAVVPEKSESIIAPTETATPALAVEENQQEKKEEVSLEETMQKQQFNTVLTEDDEESDESEDIDGTRRDSVDSCVSSGSGNLGDAEEDGSCGKSVEDDASNDNDSSSDVVSSSGNTEEDAKEVAQKIISQVESMFSDEHLAKDGFLLKHVRRRSDGFVSLKLVAGLRKVKQISREFPVVLDALKDSSKLEINSEGTKVRRVEPLTVFLKSVPIKSKDKENKPGKENGSSNEEQNPAASNKIGSKAGNENGHKQGNNQNRRHSTQVTGNQSRKNSNAHNHHNRRASTTSTGSSNTNSRHNSFSKPPGHGSSSLHPADLFRNVYTSSIMAAYSSSGEDSQSPQTHRRRGGSLPITALQRANGAHMSPNSSPPNNGAFVLIGPGGGARPKSNSYCEGAGPSTMSPWLQRRKASEASRLSSGELVLTGVVRQPRGPDGTKGFACGYRAMILQERLHQQSNSAVSA